jgi:hypothetical protein
MKALSLRQPWCHAVLYYGKLIENRKWNTHFRGEFLIHAAKSMLPDYYAKAEAFIVDVLGWADADCAKFRRDFEARARFGGIVGRSRLVDVVRPLVADLSRGDVERLYPPGVNPKWHMREQYGFVLADVTPLPFTPLQGRLSFFNVPDAVVASLGVS